MNILHVMLSVDPRTGGPGHAIRHIVREQVAAGHRVSLVATTMQKARRYEPHEAFARRMTADPDFSGADVFLGKSYGRRKPLSSFSYSPQCGRRLRQMISGSIPGPTSGVNQPPDVIHIHGVFSHVTSAAAAFARRHSIPYVIRPAGSLNPACFRLGSHRLKQLFSNLVLRKDLDRAACIHAMSDQEADLIRECVPADRIHVVPHGVVVPNYDRAGVAENFLARFPQLRGKRIVLFMARVAVKKRPELLVEALSQLRSEYSDLALLVAGYDDGHMPVVNAAVKRHGLEDAVFFSGFLQGELKQGALAAAEVFALPSIDENFGVAVVEAMAHGVPVLLTPGVATHTFVDESGGGQTIEGTARSFADGIRWMLGADRKLIGQRGRQHVRDHLSWPAIIGQIDQMYRDGIASHNRSRPTPEAPEKPVKTPPRPLRILFFSHYFPPEVNAPATRTFDHCTRWAKAGHDVTVVTCAPNCPDGVLYNGYRNTLGRQVEWIDGVRVVRVWTYLAANAGMTRRILNYLSYLFSAVLASFRLPRPDVVVATSPQFFCGWAGTVVSWLKRVPLVLEIRDIWPESIRAVGAMKSGPLFGLLERMERWLYRSARHVVAVGTGYRTKILEKLHRPDRVSVITNGVDPRVFVPDEPHPRLLHAWDLEDKFVCSYVGTIGMAHGLEVVLEAAKILKGKGRTDIAFCLVGDGAARERLQARAEREGLTDLVVFTGRQPKEEIPPILASSDACLIHLKKCSLFETVLPSKLFEVMAMARPVIMGVRGEALDIVRAADAGLEMEPGSADDLVEAVETLAENPTTAAGMGRSGRDYVEEHFDRDELASRYLRLLADVAGVRTVEIPVAEPVAVEQVMDNSETPENAER